MKKLFNCLAALAIILLLNSCGEGYEAAEVTVKTLSTVSGTLSQYVTVGEKDYTIYIDPENWPHCSLTLNVAVEKDPKLESDTNKVDRLRIEAILLDENETPISISMRPELGTDSEFESALKTGANRLALKFQEDSRLSAEEAKKIKDKAKYVEVKVSGEIKKKETSKTYSSDDIDDCLDRYEAVTDKYVIAAEKRSKGDKSATVLADYIELNNKLSEISSKLNEFENGMSKAQKARRDRIMLKIASVDDKDSEADKPTSSSTSTEIEEVEEVEVEEVPVMTTTSSSASTSSASSKNIDKWLDQYEKVMDKYVKVAAKAAKGDMPSITEAASLSAEVTSLASKLDDVESEMSAAQAARLAKIAAKMASAM